MESIIVALAAGGVALLFAAFTAFRVMRADPGNARMRAIGDAIRDGSSTFLRREYMVLAPFFIVVADLLDHLRGAYSPDNPVSYDELFDQVRNVPVLILDDLGSHSTTPWAQEKLFQVMNHRFNLELSTVITVRGPLQQLDESLRTRIESTQDFSHVYQLGQYNTRLARSIGDLPTEMQRRMTFGSYYSCGCNTRVRSDWLSSYHAKYGSYYFAHVP